MIALGAVAALAAPVFDVDVGPVLHAAVAGGTIAARTPDAWVFLDGGGAQLGRLPREGGSHCDLPLVAGPALLLARVLGDDRAFDLVVDGEVRAHWTHDVLGVYPHQGGALVVVSPEPGRPPVRLEWRDLATGELLWAHDDAALAAPPLVLAAPASPCALWTADAVPGPVWADGLVTRWAPQDGLVRRDPTTGQGTWRLVTGDPAPLLTSQGFADLVVTDGIAVLPVSERAVGAVAADTGQTLWRRTTGRPAFVAVGGGHVVVGGDGVSAYALATGRRAWRARWPAEVTGVVRGHVTWVLDARGVITRVDDDGGATVSVDLAGEALARVVAVELRGDALVARLDAGAVGLDATTGALKWRVDGRTPALRCPVPALADPEAHVWLGADGVHRTDLDTGEDRVIDAPIGCDLAWDAVTGTVVTWGDGHLRGWR